MGRKTLFEPGMCDQLIELMEQGATFKEVCLDLGIQYRTATTWKTEGNPRYIQEFAEAYEEGRALSEGWWLKEGRTNLRNKEFNYTGWYMQMKNLHGWSDKHTHANDKENPMPTKIEVVLVSSEDGRKKS